MRLWLNVWMLVGLPLLVVTVMLECALFVYSTDWTGYLVAVLWLIVVLIIGRTVLRYIMVSTRHGLWWPGGWLPWREVQGFTLREWNEGLFPQFVVVAVCAARSVELYATCRFRSRAAAALMTELRNAQRGATAG